MEASGEGVIEPKLATVARYGLSLDEWRAMLVSQGGVCAICRKVPKNRRLCTDHEHVRGWKKMPAHRRKTYVRGLACFTCNFLHLAKGMSADKARNVVSYLEHYESRRAALAQSVPG